MNFYYFDACRHLPIGSIYLHYLWWDEKLNFWGDCPIQIAVKIIGSLGGKSIEEQIKDHIYNEIHPPGTMTLIENQKVPRPVADQANTSNRKVFYTIPSHLIIEDWFDLKNISFGDRKAVDGKHKCICPREIWMNGCKCGGT